MGCIRFRTSNSVENDRWVLIFIPWNTIVKGYYGFMLNVQVSVRSSISCMSVCLSVFRFWMITWVTSMDFHQNWYVRWYCDLVWDCQWANFVKFWWSYLPELRLYFRFQIITWVNLKLFYPSLVHALILMRSVLGLLMGKFHQFLIVICLQHDNGGVLLCFY